MLKIVLAPDSFKGTMNSAKVCQILSTAFRSHLPTAELISMPMADGGEGTLAAVLTATGAPKKSSPVQDPLGRPIEANFTVLPEKQTAFVEMALASGLERLLDDERNPLVTSTYGTGQLISAALDAGASEIIIGIGGSATVDGGAGLAQALGCRLLDSRGQPLPPGGAALNNLARLELDSLDQRLRSTKIRVACDVTNPLLGTLGAATIFGPQKGASPTDVAILESGLEKWAQAIIAAGLVNDCEQPGDGAAGGLGFALRALGHAEMVSGAHLIAELTGLHQAVANADLVITGEGKTDSQTLFGKLPAVVADLAAQAAVPCVLISGAVTGDQAPLRKLFAACFSTINEVLPLQETLNRSTSDLEATAHAVAGLVAASAKRKGVN